MWRGDYCLLLALTPTLSPKEREAESAGLESSDAARYVAAAFSSLAKQPDELRGRANISSRRRMFLPLPGGEVWGEGERSSNIPGRDSPRSSRWLRRWAGLPPSICAD